MSTKRAAAPPIPLNKDEALAVLRNAVLAVQQAEKRCNEAAVAALSAGATFDAVGTTLGMTRQAAHERYSACAR